jgi:hypothetical protein
VRAAEDHGVDAGLPERTAEPVDAGDDALVDLAALLDQRRQLGGRDRMKLGARRRLGEGARVGAARDGRRGGDEPDPPVPRGRRGQPRLGRDDPNDRHAALEFLAERGQRRGRGRVACDHEQLRAPVEQDAGQLAPEAKQLLGRAVAVREARGVPEIEKVLVRKRHEALVQHGEPADPGVEDGNGQLSISARQGDVWSQDHPTREPSTNPQGV